MQVNLTVNIRDDFWEVFSDRYTQGDRYIQVRYIQVWPYFKLYIMLFPLSIDDRKQGYSG